MSQVLFGTEVHSGRVGDAAVAAEELLEAVVGAATFRVCGPEDAHHVHHPLRGSGIWQHDRCVGVPPVGRITEQQLNHNTSDLPRIGRENYTADPLQFSVS